jgi:hypothetical protein
MNPASSNYLLKEMNQPPRQDLIIQLVNVSPGHPSFKKEGKFICAKSDLVHLKKPFVMKIL